MNYISNYISNYTSNYISNYTSNYILSSVLEFETQNECQENVSNPGILFHSLFETIILWERKVYFKYLILGHNWSLDYSRLDSLSFDSFHGEERERKKWNDSPEKQLHTHLTTNYTFDY